MTWLRGAEGAAQVPKLSESQAIQIARTAASAAHGTRELTIAAHTVKDGRIVWSVSEPSVGSMLVVDVDDETAKAVTVRVVGLR